MSQTEHKFVLPIGYRDNRGNLHREGVMREATAGDEILPLKDPRVQANPGYLFIMVLSRVVVSLGSLDTITTRIIEELRTGDYLYLLDFYKRINHHQTHAAPEGKES